MPQIFIAAAGAVGVSTTAIVTIGSFAISAATIVGYAAYTVVTGFALNALNKKAASKARSSAATAAAAQKGYGTTVNSVSPAADHAIIYGQQRVGGAVFYRSVTGDQQYLHSLIALAGHECEEIGTIYANDLALTIDGNGFVTNDEYQIKDADGNFQAYALRINKHLGAANQAADADLLLEDSAWTADHRAQGVAYIYIRAEHDPNVFPQGLPTFSAVVKGKKVYDPRTSSTAWSANAALCLRDYLINSYGLGAETSEVNDTVFATAANICDENVALAAGGTEKRYAINGSFTTALPPDDIITDLVASMAGTIWYGQGQWGIKAGAYTSPVLTLDEDDLRSQLQINTRHSRRDNFNAVTGTFSGPDSNYQPTDYPQVTSAAFVTVDGGETVTQDISLPFTSTPTMAQRLAKIALYRQREQLTISGTFGLKALQLQIGDIVNITNTRLGFSSKNFEVIDWRFGFGTDQTLEVVLTLREISSTVYSWDAEESAFESNNTTLPSPFLTAAAGVSLDAELRIVNQAAVGVLLIDVTASQTYVDKFEVEYKKSTGTSYIRVGRQTGGRFEVSGLEDGQYDVRARTINSFGVKSAWTIRAGFDLSVFAPAPETVSNFTGNVVGNSLHLTWTPVTDLDLSHYKVRYSSLTSGAVYSNAVDVLDKVSRPGNSAVVPAQTGTYFIKAVDKIGGLSEAASSFVVVVDPHDTEEFNAIQTITEHPAFSGTTSNVVSTTDTTGALLILDTTDSFDDPAGNFDDALGQFDSGNGTIASSGTYQFNSYVDFGEKYTSRVYPTFKVDYIDYVNTFDGASGLFDDREGAFDGDSSQFDVTSAKLQLRHTDDDPAGSPTYTDWQDFIVADISARALQFRVRMTSTNGSATPAVRELAVQVDMPERVEAQSDITFTGTTNITFPTAFKATPAIGVALANLADGERYAITSKSRTGFTITIFDGASQSTNSVDLDYVAKGYGKELT
jgi:predicted phage tail protein